MSELCHKNKLALCVSVASILLANGRGGRIRNGTFALPIANRRSGRISNGMLALPTSNHRHREICDGFAHRHLKKVTVCTSQFIHAAFNVHVATLSSLIVYQFSSTFNKFLSLLLTIPAIRATVAYPT